MAKLLRLLNKSWKHQAQRMSDPDAVSDIGLHSKPEYLPEVTAKLARAAEVQKDLTNQISRFLSSGNFGVDYQRESDETWLLTLRMQENPPLAWSMLVGDVIHNLRSSLDLALFTYIEVVCPNQFAALSNEVRRNIQFPIYNDESRYDQGRWHAGIPTHQLRQDLRQVQPFHFAQFLEYSEEKVVAIRNSPLAQLRDMSNQDKHRGVHLVVAGLNLVTLGLDEGQVSDWKVVDQPPWQDGSRIFRVTVNGAEHLERLRLTDSFEIALESDSCPLNVYSIDNKLDALRSKVEWCHWLLWRWQAHVDTTGI